MGIVIIKLLIKTCQWKYDEKKKEKTKERSRRIAFIEYTTISKCKFFKTILLSSPCKLQKRDGMRRTITCPVYRHAHLARVLCKRMLMCADV